MNTLCCYLFYKLTGDGVKGKGISAFAILPNKGLTVEALLDKNFLAIPTTDNKPTPFITPETVAYIFALVIGSVTIFNCDSPHSRALAHQASVLKELDDMPPDQVRAELRDSLTAFYEKILKKVGAGGSPVGKALPREAEKIPVPVPVPSTEDAEEGHGEGEDPPPPLPAAAQAAADGAAAPGCPAPPPTPPPKAAPAVKGGKSQKEGGDSA